MTKRLRQRRRKPDTVTEASSFIRFVDGNGAANQSFTVEANVGQLAFAGKEEEFIAFMDSDHEAPWYMTRREARRLCTWISKRLDTASHHENS